MPSPADDLRALLAEPDTEMQGWLLAIYERRADWLVDHGAAVLALLDAAQAAENDLRIHGRGEVIRNRPALAAAVARLTEETT